MSFGLRMRRGEAVPTVSKRGTLAPNKRKNPMSTHARTPLSLPAADKQRQFFSGDGSLKNERAALRQVPLRDTSEQARKLAQQANRQRRQRRQLSEQSERKLFKVSATTRVCTNEYVPVCV